jgi:hypothetical protein
MASRPSARFSEWEGSQMRFFALSLIVVGLMASTASARVWTDASGGKIEAEYLGIEQGMVKLEVRPSGRVVSFRWVR